VFCGYPVYELHRLDRANDITGVAVGVDIAGTINLARTSTRSEATCRCRRDRPVGSLLDIARQGNLQKGLPGAIGMDRPDRLHMHKLLERVSSLPDSTAILYLNIQNASGKNVSTAEAMHLVSKSANAPLYNFWDTALAMEASGGA